MNKQTLKGYVLAGVIVILGLAMSAPASAGVDINISLPLFGLFYDERPPVVMAPAPYGYGVSAASSVFYGGYWYLPSGGNWFIAAQAGGPWMAISMDRVPYAVISGPVLMDRPRAYSGVPDAPSVGITINPWIGIGGRGGHGHGHDD